tara:strand:+ start:94 stop:582 length:489 start_codon:yes stop_codon:yes gene_type:complete
MEKLIRLTLIGLFIVLHNVMAEWNPSEASHMHERALLAAVIVAEAGGEGKAGMEAVYEVIWQRVSLTGRTYTQVITRRKQFSCLNGVKPDALIERSKKHKHYEWVRLGLLWFPPLTVHTVSAGEKKVIRNRADHYFAHKQVAPKWSNGKGKVIGNHTFERHK